VREGARRGGALIVCVLLLLGMELLAHGALLMAREDLAVSLASAALLKARMAAGAGIASVLAHPAPGLPDTLARGGSAVVAAGDVDGVPYRVSARRLSRETWLLAGEGASRTGAWIAREGEPAWRMDPFARVGSFRGVVEVGDGAPVAGTADIDALDAARGHPLLDAAACRTWEAALDSLAVAADLLPVSSFPPSPRREPTLGFLDSDALVASAGVRVDGSGTPAPHAGPGGCVEGDAWNWGDPDDPAGPCHAHRVFAAAASSLVVSGGVGQGILVVPGDLSLTDGARFYGLVLVGGRLALDGDARLVGLARAAGGLDVSPGAEVVGSACWASTALRDARGSLGRVLPLPGAGRLGPLSPSSPVDLAGATGPP
jgi:hypothetical protein